jgi:ligand-binding sensor domain-containing protein
MPYFFILCYTFLILVTNSCSSKSQSNIISHHVSDTVKNPLLKYTTGVRSILEDSKGNTWFGSYNEGVCLLRADTLQYFTMENGLSDNQVRSIYEDKHGNIWFECGRGLSMYVVKI